MLRLTAVPLLALIAALSPPADATPPRAMWLWDPAPLLSDTAARRSFFTFCEQQHVGVVWAQIATPIDARWKALLAEAHRRDFKVHALDGDPTFVRGERHAAALAIVDAVIVYNASVAAAERFDGVHFDNEPYTLLEWRVPARRRQLLADYETLNRLAAAKIHTAGGLEYGVDVPFWWNAEGALDPLLAVVDNIGIMDYRNAADGPDGIIAHAIPTLDAAEMARRPRVYVGIETTVERGDYVFVAGLSRATVDAAIASMTPAATLLETHRARVVDVGDTLLAGVKADANADAALASIAATFGVRAGGDVGAAAAALRQSGEWQEIRPRTVPAAGGTSYAGLAATYTTPAKITFAGRPLAELTRELAAAERAFSGYRSYHGIAIHDYVGYRALK